MKLLSSAFYTIQRYLLPFIEEEVGELTEKQRELVRVIELIDPVRFMSRFIWCGKGRPTDNRLSIFKAFVAKTVFNIPTTKGLREQVISSPSLRRLCGWEHVGTVPSEATFSRAFAEFSKAGILPQIHEAIIREHVKEEKLVGHISRDSTAIKGRERACRKNAPKKKAKGKRGRPVKGDERPAPPPRRLELQPFRTLEENLADLPSRCDWGTKRDSHGKKMSWKGYKLHVDCMDGGVPVSAILTSASPHDSQAAIPLAQMTKERVTSLYDLMDSAYDAPEIRSFSKSLGHVPIIDSNKRKGEKTEFSPAEKKRYNERSTAERFNSELKDNFGGNAIRVKGHVKVFTHLMFGIVAITVKQLLNMLI
jgi:hypothetical protein